MILFMKVTKFAELLLDRSVIVAVCYNYVILWIEYLLIVVLSMDVDELTAKISLPERLSRH